MARMRHRFRAHLGLIWLFSRRCILYNLALSLLGGAALFAYSLLTTEPGNPMPDGVLRAARVAAIMAAVLVMTGGQALALVAMRLFHSRELPYYRNAGLGAGILSLASWFVALVAGGCLLAAGLIWT